MLRLLLFWLWKRIFIQAMRRFLNCRPILTWVTRNSNRKKGFIFKLLSFQNRFHERYKNSQIRTSQEWQNQNGKRQGKIYALHCKEVSLARIEIQRYFFYLKMHVHVDTFSVLHIIRCNCKTDTAKPFCSVSQYNFKWT